jgi:hypothetical protein
MQELGTIMVVSWRVPWWLDVVSIGASVTGNQMYTASYPAMDLKIPLSNHPLFWPQPLGTLISYTAIRRSALFLGMKHR